MTQQSELNLQGIDFEEGYIAVIDKPLEWTSSDVVRKIKFALRRAGYPKIKVGHAGTLDPLATGILLVCIGKATKMADALQAEEKEYVADLMLGATTPSFDLEHPIDKTYPFEHITREAVEEVLRSLTGERLQTPPLYSAKKVEGVRAYELARAGVGVIVISSELPEIINMCDNVCVIKAGKMTGMLGREELDQERIMQYAAGGEE